MLGKERAGNKKFILNTSISYYYETHKKGEDNE